MSYDPQRHHRHSIRWKGRDYAQIGVYFVTLCTHDHESLFGHIVSEMMSLNAAGCAAASCWQRIPAHFPNVELDEFIVMPNHLHGLLMITRVAESRSEVNPSHRSSVGANHHSPNPPANNAPLDIAADPHAHANGFPTIPTAHHRPNVRANDNSPLQARGTSGTVGSIVRGFKIGVAKWMRRNMNVHDVWQRNYFEHVVRNEQSLADIRRYIHNNPAAWPIDPENPRGSP